MQLYFPRDEEVPSVEMLQKRLDSLREIPNIPEDDTCPSESSKSDEQTPMDSTEENTQSVSDTSNVMPSSQESSKENKQQDVPGQKDHHDHDDDQQDDNSVISKSDTINDKSLSGDNQNPKIPFTGEDTTPVSGDGSFPMKDEEKIDTKSAKNDQDDVLSSETSQKNDIPFPGKDQKSDTSQSSDLQLQDSSSVKSNDNQSLSQNRSQYQKDDTPTNHASQSPNDTKSSDECDTKPPTLQKSVTAPPSKLNTFVLMCSL